MIRTYNTKKISTTNNTYRKSKYNPEQSTENTNDKHERLPMIFSYPSRAIIKYCLFLLLLPWLMAFKECFNVTPSAPPLLDDNPPSYNSVFGEREKAIERKKRDEKQLAKKKATEYLNSAQREIKKCKKYEKAINIESLRQKPLEDLVQATPTKKIYAPWENNPSSELKACRKNLGESIGMLKKYFKIAETSLKEVERHIKKATELESKKKSNELDSKKMKLQGELERIRLANSKYLIETDGNHGVIQY